jgi:hypothetical protein
MDEDVQLFFDRQKELIAQGMDSSLAFGKAYLEKRISEWPNAWGENLHIIVFGDFLQPECDLIFEEFGITIFKEKVENSIAVKAVCVLKAVVTIPSRTVESLVSASTRINNLLGILSLVGWGNGSLGWWS